MRAEDIRRHRRQVREFQRSCGALMGSRACFEGVNLPQCHVLLALEEAGSENLGDLAETLRLDKSTVSRTTDGLVERGLVHRTSDPDDRRFVVLDLTDAGKSQVELIQRTADDNVRRIFALIPEDRRNDVLECFGLLVEAVTACDDEDGSPCCGDAGRR